MANLWAFCTIREIRSFRLQPSSDFAVIDVVDIGTAFRAVLKAKRDEVIERSCSIFHFIDKRNR